MTENRPPELDDVEGDLTNGAGALARKLVIAGVLALSMVFVAAGAAPTAQASTIAAQTAQAGCNTTSLTWPFCHIGRPSIPRFDVNGPRPPLTPKKSIWCTANFITVGNGVGWYRVSSTKHDIQFWPDYYHYEFVGIFWNGRAWVQTRRPVYDSVDCDA